MFLTDCCWVAICSIAKDTLTSSVVVVQSRIHVDIIRPVVEHVVEVEGVLHASTHGDVLTEPTKTCQSCVLTCSWRNIPCGGVSAGSSILHSHDISV